MMPREALKPGAPSRPVAETARPQSGAGPAMGEAIVGAMALLQAGHKAEALRDLQAFAGAARSSDVACYYFGLIHFNAQERSAALVWFEAALKLNAHFVEAMSARAVVLHDLGHLVEARLAFDDLVDRTPDDADAWQSRGLVCQKLGHFEEALNSYDVALDKNPDHAAALADRGNLLQRRQRFQEALACFDRLVQLKPDDSVVWFNRGAILDKLGRSDEALRAFDAAARLRPDDADVHLNRAVALQKLDRLPEALACCDACLAARGDWAEAHFNRGMILHRLRQLPETLAAYEAALRAKPIYPAALCNLGNVLHELGQSEKALRAFANAIKQQPQFPQAWANRAHVLYKTGRFEDTVAAAAEALRQRPGHAPTLTTLGLALQALGRLKGAGTAFAQALHVAPDYPEAWLNLGTLHQARDALDKALACYTEALRFRPDYAEAFSNLGVLMREMGRMDESLAAFNRALVLKPDYADARNNRAGTFLLNGHLAAGWQDLESRWDRPSAPQKIARVGCPVWAGQALAGRKIVVLDEQGLGDLIQFARYLPLLAGLGAEVTLVCRRTMHKLLKTLPAAIRLIDKPEAGVAFDYQIALMSLPRLFETTLTTIPAARSYLRADPAAVAAWREKLGPATIRLGICWRGNMLVGADRSIPLDHFSGLAEKPGVELVSLMKGGGRLPPDSPVRTLGQDFDAGPDAFADAAAVLQNIDLVITCDTSMAHLAGALGRPVWVALKKIPDWRWLLERTDSPWYPSMRLFRQKKRGDWEGVFEQMTRELASLI